jgi:hypothetical protein
MQKKSFIVAGSALVAVSLFAATPAHAADTVTTSDVAPTAWSQVVNPYQTETPSDVNYLADFDLTSEPLTFPFATPNVLLPAGTPGSGWDIAWLAPAPAEGCARVVNGFSASITNPTQQTTALTAVAMAASSTGLESTDPDLFVDPPTREEFGLDFSSVATNTTQVFTATLAEPVAWSADVSAILAFDGEETSLHTFTVNSVTFNVTDTCAEAVVPPVVMPAVEAVAPTAPAPQPALANTGADFAPMGIAAGALLLGGIAAVGAAGATRRIRSTRP